MSGVEDGESSGDAQTVRDSVVRAAEEAKRSAPRVAVLSTGTKNHALQDIADALRDDGDLILAANQRDQERADRAGVSEHGLDVLSLDRARLHEITEGVREVAALPDPVGEVLRGSRRPNGLTVQEVRVPLGVIGVIYENRPNTTAAAIALCLKAGNAVVLHGGVHARETNRAIYDIAVRAAGYSNLPTGAIQWIESGDPVALDTLISLKNSIDLLIPRGQPDVIAHVVENAAVPTLVTGSGNCHVFVERTANLAMAADIAFNAKCNRPGVVNSMETLLIDRPVAAEFLRNIGTRMQAAGVEIRGCPVTCGILRSARPATEEDWSTQFLDLILAVRVVDGIETALSHISRYGTHLAEAIVTENYTAAKHFCERVDAAAVYVNASTRFTDGYELGLGAELGISTQRLHRRGPIGLRALTTWKWIIQGEGQVRD